MQYGALNTLEFDILVAIGWGINTNKNLHQELKDANGKRIPKSTISRYVSHLVQIGLLTKTTVYNERLLELSGSGKAAISKFVSGGDVKAFPKFPIRGHSYRFSSEIQRSPQDFVKSLHKSNWVEYYPNNWVGYQKNIDGCNVMITTKSILFLPPATYGCSPEDCLSQALSIVLAVITNMHEDYPGLLIGSPKNVTTLIEQHYAQPLNPAAIWVQREEKKNESTFTYNSERITLDHSEGFAELETTNNLYAKDDMTKLMDFFDQLVRSNISWEQLLKSVRTIERVTGISPGYGAKQLSSSFTIRKTTTLEPLQI